MKTKIILLLFVSIGVIVSCAPKTAVNKDQVIIDSLFKISIDIYNSGDAHKIADLFSDDALKIVNGKSIWTKDSIYASYKPLAPVLKNFRAYLGPTTIKDDLIQMQKYFTSDIIAGDKTLKGKGFAIIVWKKQTDNSWKIVMETSNYNIKTF